MRKTLAAALFFLLAGLLLLESKMPCIMAEPDLLVVDDDGLTGFKKIQDAINAAQEGDMIQVKPGTYYEKVAVNKSVSLVGENKSTTIVDGNGTGTVFLVTAYNVTIEGFLVRNGQSGIYVLSSSNCLVDGNLVENHTARGILISRSQNCTVRNNYATNIGETGYGININASQRVVVEENAASDNYFDGIGFFSSTNSIMRKNTINGNLAFGIVIDYRSSDNMIYDNNIFNNGIQVGSSNQTNSWDNGTEGNYWGDYAGIDANGDGIGDTPYIVDRDTQQKDNCPLIRPYLNDIYLSVDTQPPVASFTFASGKLYVNESVSFNASDSYDSVGKNAILSYEWDFGDGTVGTGVIVDHAYLSSGNFIVLLTVVDVAGNEDADSAEVRILQKNAGDQTFLVMAIGALVAAIALGITIFVLWKKGKLR